MKTLAVIPSRMNSSRLPGKPLKMIAGKPMIEHVYKGTAAAPFISKTVVATDHPDILACVKRFGGEAVLTRDNHPNGTSRIAEAALLYRDYETILNIQGDEPLVTPQITEKLIEAVVNHNAKMTTLKKKIVSYEEMNDPNTVKVVTDIYGRALYFSRSPIPFERDREEPPKTIPYGFKHIGMYGFRRDFLFKYLEMEPSKMEKTEKLEQLRVLENGFTIYVSETDAVTVDVNIAEDLKKTEKILTG